LRNAGVPTYLERLPESTHECRRCQADAEHRRVRL